MKKTFIVGLTALLGTFLIWTIYPTSIGQVSKNFYLIEDEEENEKEEEDGILEVQQLEFEITKDIALGYIPYSRLIATTESFARQRLAQNFKKANTLGLNWIERGPDSDVVGPSNGNTRAGNGRTAGRVRAVWVDLADNTNQTVWVGGIDGGIWKTTNIGDPNATWTPINDYLANMAVGSICQDPTNTNILYFGTGEKTFNADAVRGGGIWKSVDHGATWNIINGTQSFWNVSKILCDSKGNVYVSTIGNGNGILRSTDKGASWTNILPTGLTNYVTEMEISNLGRLHVVCGYRLSGTSGYRYTDDPENVLPGTWSAPATTFPTNYNTDLAVSGNSIYALAATSSYETPFVYKSIDGGANWAQANSTAMDTEISSGQGWYCLAIAVDPNNDQNLVAGGLNTFQSKDGGATWNKVGNWVGTSLSYVHADVQVAVWNGDQVILGTDGGIHLSKDGAATFKDRNKGLRIKQFYSVAAHPTDPNYFLGGTQDNGVHQLSKPGLASSVEVTGGDGAFVHIDQNEPQYQFGSYVYNNYRRSTNGGATWSSVNLGNIGQFINPSDYDNTANKMYAGGSSNQYVRWENPQTGANFTQVNLPGLNGTVRHVSVSPYTPGRVFFGSSSGKILRTDNADGTPVGVNIAKSGMPSTNVSCVAVGTNDSNLMATFSNYGQQHVWMTTNSGDSWTNISGNLPDIPVRWAIFYPESNTKAILATEMGVFETANINGASTVWVQNSGFPFVRTDMLKYRNSDGTVAAATHGRGIFTAQIPKTIPYVRFESVATTLYEATTDTAHLSRYYKDYQLNMLVDLPPSGDAKVTLSIDPGSIAKIGIDFEITTNGNFASPSNELNFLSGSNTPQSFTVRIYDDAEHEDDEIFTINYTVSGSTNAIAAPSSLQSVILIKNNKTSPVYALASAQYIVGTRSYYLGNQTASQPFDSKLKSKKSQMLYKAAELLSAGFSAGAITSIGFDMAKSSTRPYKNLKIKLGASNDNYLINNNVLAATNPVVHKAYSSYNTINGFNDFNLDQPFIWDGISSIIVEICYENDDANASELSDRTIGYYDGGISNQANLIWQNDLTCAENFDPALLQSYGSGLKPYIRASISAIGNTIAITGSSLEHVASNGMFYFYSGKKILTSLSGATSILGSVNTTILESGPTWKSYSQGNRSAKVFEITPSQNQNATYSIGLYYSNAELDGKDPATLKIAKSNAANVAGSDASNTGIGATTVAAYGNGYVFTASFQGFSKFFLVDANVILPVTIVSFTGSLKNSNAVLEWKTSTEMQSDYFEVQKSSDGVNFKSIGKVKAAENSSTLRNYTYTDSKLAEMNYYRLKIVDRDGKFTTSNTVLIRNTHASQRFWISGNPFHDAIKVNFEKTPKTSVKVDLISINGVKVFTREYPASTQINIQLAGQTISNGTYILRTTTDDKTYLEKVVKQ
jgi:hypothetical protein